MNRIVKGNSIWNKLIVVKIPVYSMYKLNESNKEKHWMREDDSIMVLHQPETLEVGCNDDISHVFDYNSRPPSISDGGEVNLEFSLSVGRELLVQCTKFVVEVFRHVIIIIRPIAIMWHVITKAHAAPELGLQQIDFVQEKYDADIGQ